MRPASEALASKSAETVPTQTVQGSDAQICEFCEFVTLRNHKLVTEALNRSAQMIQGSNSQSYEVCEIAKSQIHKFVTSRSNQLAQTVQSSYSQVCAHK